MPVSLNILGMPQPDVTQLLNWIAAARPKFVLVMDNPDLATRVGMLGPTVIYRHWRSDDAALHETMTPEQFLLSIAHYPASWVIQCLNEPRGDQRTLAAWCAELIARADRQGRRLALPNWSTGNPDPEAIADGLYDPLWRALAASGRHLLAVHEYAKEDPAREPWHVGRYRAILRRFDALGLTRPRIIVTEAGRDLGGGKGDGWRSVFSEEQYADFLAEAQAVYNADGITALVFAFGSGFGWDSFNVEGATTLLARMAAMNGDEMGLPGWTQARTKNPAVRVNVREKPALTAPVVATIATGDWVKPLGQPVPNGGHRWQQIVLNEPDKCVHGYVSLEVVDV